MKRGSGEYSEECIHIHKGFCVHTSVLEFLNNLWGLGIEEEQVVVCRSGPPFYTDWRDGFFGIDSWASEKLKIRAQCVKSLESEEQPQNKVYIDWRWPLLRKCSHDRIFGPAC